VRVTVHRPGASVLLDGEPGFIVPVQQFLIDATGELVGIGERDRARAVPADINDTDATVTEHAASYRAFRKFFQTCHLTAASPTQSRISGPSDHGGQRRRKR
jgi:hypothetical protein